MVLFDVLVGVPLHVAWPAAGYDDYKTHALFDQPAREQAAPSVVVRGFAPLPYISTPSFLARQVNTCAPRLHAERQL
jgi:hypothetical protein